MKGALSGRLTYPPTKRAVVCKTFIADRVLPSPQIPSMRRSEPGLKAQSDALAQQTPTVRVELRRRVRHLGASLCRFEFNHPKQARRALSLPQPRWPDQLARNQLAQTPRLWGNEFAHGKCGPNLADAAFIDGEHSAHPLCSQGICETVGQVVYRPAP